MVSQQVAIELILDAVVFFFIGAWFSRFYLRHPFRRKPVTGKDAMIGKTGIVVNITKNNFYEVSVDSEIWRALPLEKNDKFQKGDEVIIKDIRSLVLYIQKIK
ncbi:NfeD family protein [Picrophilus oshimae]|uniref:Hypothetical membrane associated protein n=1 Tax=Picrophilus torridus (strain ATCC 700027 / DSM 9790 / JCM 10055 / NBRC 100828 / KAW 2/3) TaxID=1122961 RepID=Q6KYW0_PICTO|nr:NfeD family protein [Picrophilus oshimae]AAT44092.1 hypothetical membrane associated protein [Picrophilus oshimae DSM 9789]SMD30839.1 NfeD-like C-terminal, partner-binding [Picrophilus oshimae DSM 9789]